VILNGAKIGKNCIVGAGSVVTENKEFPDGSMIIGTPAKLVRMLDEKQIAGLAQNVKQYVANARVFAKGLKKIG
jgi:carbonic anhydrase/acetyltransferase-like protein (isoleucine patch superfamily)